MWSLRFDGVNDIVSISSGMTGNAGTSAYTMRVKSGPLGITLPASSLAGIIGTSSASTSSGLVVTSTGQLRIYTAGTNRYGSTAQLIFNGVPFDYTLTHNADGTWNIYNNLTASPTGESGTFTTSTAFSTLNQFGRSSNAATMYLQGDINLISVTGLTNGTTWDAGLSEGAGGQFKTAGDVNNGTLVNFPTNGTQWTYSSTASPIYALDIQSSTSGANSYLTLSPSLFVNSANLLIMSFEIERTTSGGFWLIPSHLFVNSNGTVTLYGDTTATSVASICPINTRSYLSLVKDSAGSMYVRHPYLGTIYVTVDMTSGVTVNNLGRDSSNNPTPGYRIYRFTVDAPLSPSYEFLPSTSTSTGTVWNSKTVGSTLTVTGATGTANSWWYLWGGSAITSSKPLKYHNGTAWVEKPLKYHNGTSWVVKPLKYHNGTSWS